MSQAWLFLVSRNEKLDYRTVVAPDFICEARISDLLARAADGDLTAPGYAIYREIHNSQGGDITLVFRIVEAVAKDIALESNEVLKDEFGREIYLIEGIVLREIMLDIVVTHEDFEEAHKQLVKHYQNFWDWTTPNPTIPSKSFNLKTNNDLSELLILSKVEPFIVSSKTSDSIERAKLWRCVENLDFKFEVSSVTFSPDSNTIAIKYDQQVRIWDLNKQKKIFSFSGPRLLVGASVSSVAFSSDGQLIATSIIESFDQNIIKLWNLRTREAKDLSGHAISEWGRVFAVAFSPNSQLLASCSRDGIIKLWDVPTGGEIDTLSGHPSAVKSLIISPDGQILASGDGKGIIKLWSLKTGREIRTIEAHPLPVNSVAISPDSQILASGSDDHTIKLWNVKTGEEIRSFSGHEGDVNSVVFNPKSQILASGSEDNTIKLWNVKTGEEIRTLSEHRGEVTSVAISPDGQTLVSGSKDCTVKIWK